MTYNSGLMRDGRYKNLAVDSLSKPLKFGSGSLGVNFEFEDTVLNIDGVTANDTVSFGANVATDVRFDGATATRDVLWDASANSLNFADYAYLTFGTTPSCVLAYNGSDFVVVPSLGSNVIFSGDDEVRVAMHFNRSPNRYYLEEFFAQKPGINADVIDYVNTTVAAIANRNFEVLGTNAVTANTTFSATRAGVTLTTAANANDQVIIAPHLDTNQTAWTTVRWGTENITIWECSISTGASVAGVILWAGLKLTNTPTIVTDADQVYFRYEAGVDTNWNAVYSIGNADTETDTGHEVVTTQQYILSIKIDSFRVARMFIGNSTTPVATSTALTNDVDLIPYVGIQTTGGAKTMDLHYEKISRQTVE
uniref:Uncharacterized protein n=1 Tax=viral metagenome TaxID=1070528 RepID=A0A6C0LZ45_9ZZZZ